MDKTGFLEAPAERLDRPATPSTPSSDLDTLMDPAAAVHTTTTTTTTTTFKTSTAVGSSPATAAAANPDDDLFVVDHSEESSRGLFSKLKRKGKTTVTTVETVETTETVTTVHGRKPDEDSDDDVDGEPANEGAWSKLKRNLSSRMLVSYFLLSLLVFELVLNFAVIVNVAYTEIDWQAYMQEVAGFIGGEFDYAKLSGSTGPLVYPAGFVYLYSLLYFVTNGGKYVAIAQIIFAWLYVATFFVVVLIYRRSKIFPLWAIPLLMFSKRMHSIYTLRLFNDPVAMFFLFSSVLALTKKRWLRSSVLFSLALSVKMNVLLFAPGFAFVFFRNAGILVSLGNAIVVLAIQVVLAAPFLYTAPESYLTRAFDFGRQFDFKWTVNWRFVPEEIFSSPEFAMGLLALHVIFLVGFAATVWRRHIPRHYKRPQVHLWLADFISKFIEDLKIDMGVKKRPTVIKDDIVSADDTLLILFSSNLIGIIFARSLHYQFYSWYFWTIPYLLWRTGLGFNAKIAIFIMIEYAWNVYPSTNTSSTTLLLAHLILLAAVAMGNPVHDKRKSLNGGESDVDSNASTDSDDDSKNKIKTE